VVYLNTSWKAVAGESDENPASAVCSDNLAYAIYTSGSTGAPKGVAIKHRNASALIHWAGDVFSREDIEGVFASTSVSFDLSVFELFVTLSWGGKVILAENAIQLPRLSTANEVTLVNTVPSAMAELMRIGGVPASVRTVNLAGESLRTQLVKDVYQQKTIENVFDLYGPTESATYSTVALRSAEGPATIGHPIANTQVYLLDPHLNPAPVGVIGQLYIGGDGLARCYLRRPELTAEKFIPNPFRREPGMSLYNTGDLARYLPDGSLEFLGRKDHQVKIRGYRIELGEIETALGQHPAIHGVAVAAMEDVAGEKRLVAYVVPDPEAPPTIGELRSFLAEKLPHFMVPSTFMKLDALPLTPNGKVDRQRLPAPDVARTVEREVAYVAPRSEMERIIVNVWQEILGLEKAGIYDNFFDLGGHSLSMLRVNIKLGEILRREISMVDMFKYPTISSLSESLIGREAETTLTQQPWLSVEDRKDLIQRRRALRDKKRAFREAREVKDE